MCQGHDTVVTRGATATPALQRLLLAWRRTHRHRHRQQPRDQMARASSSLRTRGPTRQARGCGDPAPGHALEVRRPFSAARPADPWRPPSAPAGRALATSPSFSARTAVCIFMASSVSSRSPRGHPGALGRGDGGDTPASARPRVWRCRARPCARRPFRDLAAIGHAHRARPDRSARRTQCACRPHAARCWRP